MATMLPVLQYNEEPEVVPPASSISHSTAAGSTQHTGSFAAAQAGGEAAHSRNRHVKSKRSPDVRPQQPDKDAMHALSKERKRRAFIGMLRLLEHGAKDPQQLNVLIAPMSDEELLQVAEERSLAGKCGNPLCTHPFTWNEPRRKYRATADNIHKLEGDCYCSKSCGSFVQQLAAQLVNPMDRIQPQALQQYLAQPSHRPKQGTAAQGGGVETMKSVIEERDPFQLIHEAEEAGRQLDEAAAQQHGSTDTAAAVEGFIPRPQPTRHQQQQQQNIEESLADDSPQEVLHLNPVQKRDALASSTQAAAAAESAVASTTGNDSQQQLEGYLQAHRAHQQQQLQQLSKQQQQHAVDAASAEVRPVISLEDAHQQITNDGSLGSSAATGTAGSSVVERSSQEAATAAGHAAGDGAEQLPRRRRTVTFAPTVEYSCPAEPQQHPEHPVLTFTMHGSGISLAAGSDSGVLLGELSVAPGGDLSPEQAASAGEDQPIGVGGSSSVDDNSADAPEVPQAWRLFFPPALGGVGVPVKQVVNTRPMTRTKQQQQDQQAWRKPEQSVREEEQQQQLPQVLPSKAASQVVQHSMAASESDRALVAAAQGAAAGGAELRSSRPSHQAVTQRTARPATGNGSTEQHQEQPCVPAPDATNADVLAQGPAVGKSPNSSTATTGPRPRRFTPTVRPRRSVVLLDSVPGVTVKQRGGLRSNSGNAGDSELVQQLVGSQLAAEGGPVCAAVVPADLQAAGDNQQQQQQPQQQASGVTPSASGRVSCNNTADKAGNFHLNRAGTSSDDRQTGSDQQQDDSSTTDEDQYHNTSASVGSRGGSSPQRPHVPPGHAPSRSINSSSRNINGHAAADGDSSGFEDDDAFSGGLDDDPADSLSAGSDDEDMSSDSGSDSSKSAGDMSKQLQGALDSLLPFLDTKGVTVHLSEFGLLWNAMHAWISPSTIAYVNNKQAAAAAVTAAIGSAVEAAGGRRAAADGPAAPSAAQGSDLEGVHPVHILQQRTALANMLAPAVPLVTEQLSITVSQAELTRHLHALVRSFYMSGPLPALQLHQWQMVASLMLAALSAWRVPSMRHLFSRSQPAGSKLEVMLAKLGTDVDRFMALLDLFEINV